MKHPNRHVLVATAIATLAGLSGCDAISGYFRAQSAAVKWEGPIEEIAAADIKKDGKVFTIHMESRIDAPPEKVWEAMKHPELLSKNSEQYKKSDLLKDEGNHKELELHVMALDNLQQLTVAMDFDDSAKTLKIKTLATTIAEIDGTYTLKPSPDGTKTLYIYDAKQTDKVALPISEDVQRSAIKESFVNQVRAIKKQIGG
jgi:carbon monoxide dehydrogenase subunit G